MKRTLRWLAICSYAYLEENGNWVVGGSFCLRGSWPIYLIDAQVEGEPRAVIAPFFGLERNMAGFNVALYPDTHPHVSGPIKGWKLEPDSWSDGIRITWPKNAPSEERRIVIRYRYLGWPLTTHQTIRLEPILQRPLTGDSEAELLSQPRLSIGGVFFVFKLKIKRNVHLNKIMFGKQKDFAFGRCIYCIIIVMAINSLG